MEEHPTSEDFARFLQQSSRPSPAERSALVVRHLLAGCAVCRRTLLETDGLPALLARLLEIPLQAECGAPRCYNYEWAFAKAERALALSQEAERSCREAADFQLLANILTTQAVVFIYAGQPEQAPGRLYEAIPLIDKEEDPYLLLAALHNLAHSHIDLDRPDEALALLCELRELYRKCRDPLICLRAIWQEGQLLHAIGHLHNAQAALLRARRGFVEQGLAYEAAQVSLDLTEVYSQLGDQESVRRVVSEALPIFRSLRIGREALASLLQLQRNAEPPEIL